MRILEVTYTWPPETFIARHAAAIAQQASIEVILAPRVTTMPIGEHTIQSGYRVISLPNFDHAGTFQKIRYVLHLQAWRSRVEGVKWRDRALLRFIERLQPDLVHFHTMNIAVTMSKYVTLLGLPYTLSVRGADLQVRPLESGAYAATLNEVVHHCSRVHTVVDSFSTQLAQLVSVEFISQTIRTCVPIPEIAHSVRRDREIRFVTVGRLHWRKGYIDLIRAFSCLPNHFTLDIIGEGDERPYILFVIHELGLQDQVILHGNRPYPELLDMFYTSTAYVQTSVAEGFSNALGEAMALGMPVFATPVGGTEEIVKNDQNGLIIPVGKPEQIAEILLRAEDSALMARLGENARTTAISMLSEELHAKEFRRFFDSALADRE